MGHAWTRQIQESRVHNDDAYAGHSLKSTHCVDDLELARGGFTGDWHQRLRASLASLWFLNSLPAQFCRQASELPVENPFKPLFALHAPRD